jgi:hypothetical protein
MGSATTGAPLASPMSWRAAEKGAATLIDALWF